MVLLCGILSQTLDLEKVRHGKWIMSAKLVNSLAC